jgi:hypothetical protein
MDYTRIDISLRPVRNQSQNESNRALSHERTVGSRCRSIAARSQPSHDRPRRQYRHCSHPVK